MKTYTHSNLRLLMTLALVVVLLAIPVVAHADVWTDQTIYVAGDTVYIAGNAMQAGENRRSRGLVP